MMMRAATAPTPVVGAVFSVSASKKVKFSKGNLYWDGSAYKFEENQYDYPSSWNTSHVGHFFWSKDDSIARASSYSDSGASVNDILFANGAETTPKSSFSVDGETGKWRALSMDEWTYLLNSRSGNRYAKARVNNVNGLLIFPDDYAGTISGTGIAEVNSSSAAFPSSSIPTAIWSEMEEDGVVFLPAGGYRYGSSIMSKGSEARYWASISTDSADEARDISFNSTVLRSPSSNTRNFGELIRLVEDA